MSCMTLAAFVKATSAVGCIHGVHSASAAELAVEAFKGSDAGAITCRIVVRLAAMVHSCS